MNILIGTDLPLGLGAHRQRVEFLYRTTTPLLTYLRPWGGEFVLVIQEGQILGVVRRDKRPIWTKLRERIALVRQKPYTEADAGLIPSNRPLADCCA
jgi:hypothetical protein